MITYCIAWLLEFTMRWLLAPLWRTAGAAPLRLSFPPCALVSYAGSIILFNRLRAAIHLDYEPIFAETDAIALSAAWYERWYIEYVANSSKMTSIASTVQNKEQQQQQQQQQEKKIIGCSGNTTTTNDKSLQKSVDSVIGAT